MAESEKNFEYINLLGSYVPGNLLKSFRENEPLESAYNQNLLAVTMFVDIAGFTPLSEKFQKLGKKGADELTFIINSFFKRMIDIVYESHGVICSFGGDAMNVIFPYENHVLSEEAILRTIQCAVQLQSYVKNSPKIITPDGEEKISIKIGIAHGPVYFTCSGIKEKSMRYFFSGPGIDGSSESEHHSAKNEITVNLRTFSKITASITGTITDEEWILLDQATVPSNKLADTSIGKVEKETVLPESLTPNLMPFVHESIQKKLKIGALIGEIRPVTTVFIKFTTLDFVKDPDARLKINSFSKEVIELAETYKGYFSAIGAGDKGMTLLLFFGAPLTYEGDEERAVQFALDLNALKTKASRDTWIPKMQIGITTGSVFTGNVGSTKRREYTIIGDRINLSARLMVLAKEDEILIDSETSERVKEKFEMLRITGVRVKGKSEPLTIYKVLNVKKKKKSELSSNLLQFFIEREDILLKLDEVNLDKLNQKSSYIYIYGPSGIGKTTITNKYCEMFKKTGGTVLNSICSSLNRNKPLALWLDILDQYFEMNPEHSKAENYRHLENFINLKFPEYSNWLNYIATLLDVIENALKEVDDNQKQRSFFEIFLRMLKTSGSEKAILIALDDLHWIDDLSEEFLIFFCNHVKNSRIKILLSSRETWVPDIKLYGTGTNISILPMELEKVTKLAELHLGVEYVPTELLDFIMKKSEGNPFYTIELINYLKVKKVIEVDSDKEIIHIRTQLNEIEMPNTVQDIIRARVDSLEEEPKHILKTGAVKGVDVPLDLIRHLIPEALLKNLNEILIYLKDQKFVHLSISEGDKFMFRPMVIQEIIYNCMLKEQLLQLHKRIADYMTKSYDKSSLKNKQEIAYHYFFAEEWRASKDLCITIISELSKAKKFEEAFLYLDWLKESIEHIIKQNPELKKILYRTCSQYVADILDIAIHHDQFKIRHFERINKYIDVFEEMSAFLEIKLNKVKARKWKGMLLGLKGELDNSIVCLEEALSLAKNIDQFEEIIKIERELGRNYQRKGHWDLSVKVHDEAKVLAEHLNNDELRLNIYLTAGTHALFQGEYERAKVFYEALTDLAEKNNNNHFKMLGKGNLGVLNHYTNKLDEAAKFYNDSYTIAKSLNNTLEMARNLHNLAEAQFDLKQFELALKTFSNSLELSDKAGWMIGYAANKIYVGFLKYKNNEHGANTLLQEGISLTVEYKFDQITPLGMFYLAQVLIYQQKFEEGKQQLQEAYNLANKIKYLKLCEDIKKYLQENNLDCTLDA